MLQHTKYIHGFREYFFKVSHNKSMEAIDPQDMARFDPRSMICRIYVGDYWTLLHTNISSPPHGFREDF